MPLSYAHSQGDGSNRMFDVPCEYLSKTHVTVKVNGVDVPFTWIDTFRLQTATAPAKGSVIEVRRTTPKVERLVTFTDGSTLVQSDLNTSTLQSFFLAQEAFDQGAASMAVTEDGMFSALNRRITSLSDPVENQDAVTKAWALSAANTNLTAAVAAKTAAETARTAAQTARTGAETARTGAETARTGAEAARDAALGYRDTASAHRLNAQNAQTAAETARNGAEAAKAGLEVARNAAAASATAAAKSASDAALFDPSSYYTKSQSDTALGLKLNSSAYTAADILAKLKTVDGANSGLDADLLDGQSSAYFMDIAGRLGFTPANNSVQVVAGNGLSGGGTLAANRTLALGTPGTLTATTANAVSATSHTHDVDTAGIAAAGTAALAAGGIGTYVFARRTGSVDPAFGATIAGSSLQPSNVNASVSGSLSGTWRCMGYVQAGASTSGAVTLWLRIS